MLDTCGSDSDSSITVHVSYFYWLLMRSTRYIKISEAIVSEDVDYEIQQHEAKLATAPLEPRYILLH